jgi:hypothetical protein
MNGRYLRKVEGRRKRRETVMQRMVSGSEANIEASLIVSFVANLNTVGVRPR